MRRMICILVLALVTAFAASPPAAAASTQYVRWGLWTPTTSVPDVVPGVGTACVITVDVWVQELGISGATRLKAKFELRSPNDPGFFFTAYATRGYYWSLPFPDDYRSFYQRFTVYFRQPAGGSYKVRAILVGVREGWWRRDRKVKVDLPGEVGCDWAPGGA